MISISHNFVEVGIIGRPKGTKGLLRLKSFLQDDREINNFKNFYIDEATTIKIKLVGFDKKSPLIIVNEIDNRTDAERFINKSIFLLRKDFPDNKTNEYYHIDLEGCKIISLKGDEVGEVINIANFGAGDLLEIEFYKSKKKEFFLFNSENFPSIDIENKQIHINK